MTTAWIGLGSNRGDKVAALSRAVEGISSLEKSNLVKLSSLYETAAVEAEGGEFINAVAVLDTGLTARELLENLLELETAMGRERSTVKGSGADGFSEARNIDLDLLLFDEEIIEEPGLTVPHPRMNNRRFVMEPMAEIDENLQIPGTGKTTAQIAMGLSQQEPHQMVKRLGTLESLKLGKLGQALDQSSPENL